MKRILLSLACAFALAAFSADASAHCGACGVGGDGDTLENCTAECDSKGAHENCPEECAKKHGKDSSDHDHDDSHGSAEAD